MTKQIKFELKFNDWIPRCFRSNSFSRHQVEDKAILADPSDHRPKEILFITADHLREFISIALKITFNRFARH